MQAKLSCLRQYVIVSVLVLHQSMRRVTWVLQISPRGRDNSRCGILARTGDNGVAGNGHLADRIYT